jgi:hypothetical protein
VIVLVGPSKKASLIRVLVLSSFLTLSSKRLGRSAELSALATREIATKGKIILPIWHGVSFEDVAERSLTLADKFSIPSDRYPPDAIALQILQVIRPDLYAETISRRIQLLDNRTVDQTAGTVPDRLMKAKKDVWISGNYCKFIAEANSGYIESLLKRDVHIKLLCVDPKSPAADMIPHIDPRFPKKQNFIESMESVEKLLRDFRKRYESNFEFRYLPILPAIGLFFIDPSEHYGLIKFEIYTAKPWSPKDSRPHFLLPAELGEWRNYFICQWTNYWNMSRIP